MMILWRVCSSSWRPPALPADRIVPGGFLLTLEPIRRGQREHQQREDHMHPHRACGFLGGMAQLPLLLGFLNTTVLDETAVIIVIKGLQWLLDQGVRQEPRFTPSPSTCVPPRR